MNPELERRLRRFGATVDRAAEAAQQHRPLGAVEPGDLENVVSLDSRRRSYRVVATVAASAAALVGVIVFASRGGSDGDSADPAASGEGPAVVVESSDAAASSSDVAPSSTEPSGTIPAPSTSTAVSSSVPAPSSTPVASTRAPETTRSPVCPSYRVNSTLPLRLCDQSDAVRQVQEALGINADGLFGPGTETAVKQFQRDHNLEVDGWVGPATWAALFPDAASTTS